jgi:hypothetical protein
MTDRLFYLFMNAAATTTGNEAGSSASLPLAQTIEGLVGQPKEFGSAVNFLSEAQRKLTKQINIVGDPYLWDDFAFATRDGLVPPLTLVTDPAALRDHDVDAPFYDITFDFTLHAEQAGLPQDEIPRAHFTA